MLFRWILPCLAIQRVAAVPQNAPASDTDALLSEALTAEISRLASESNVEVEAAEVLNRINENQNTIDGVEGVATRGSFSSRVACSLLRILFPIHYVDSGMSSYTEAEQANWSSNCWLPAKCFISPRSAFETAAQLAVIRLTNSPFSVRNHGHNLNPGWASVDETGVLIDLRKLNGRHLSRDKSVISVGAGNTWGDVYHDLDPHGLYAVGGRDVSVGVSGLIQGGGIPIIPSLYGLACDNVKNFEVVLGNSVIVNANANQNLDLYQALKGGGSNFGIVTRFDLYTVPFHHIWYKTVSLPSNNSKEILPAIVATQNAMEKDDKAGIIIQAAFGVFKVTFLYADHVSETPTPFKSLDRLECTVDVKPTNGTALSFSKSVSGEQPPVNRESAGVSTLVDLDLYTKVYNYFLDVSNFSNSPTSGLVLVIQQFGKAAAEAGKAHGKNLFDIRPVAQNWWSLLVQYKDPAERPAAEKALLGLNSYITKESQATGTFLPYIFPNTAHSTQNVMKGYGSKSLEKLTAVSKKYDRKQVFQRLLYGGWPVTKA